MELEKYGMLVTGVAALVVGLVLGRPRFQETSGAERVVVLGPVLVAAALAVFAAEHFLAAGDLVPIVPKWLPGPLFWTYFVGAAWLAAAISFITWRQVRLSAALTTLLFLIIVVSIDLPNLGAQAGDRIFWTLTVRESAFGAGAIVLAGSQWAPRTRVSNTLIILGRSLVAATMIFYGIEHFLFPLNVTGVPLEKLAPAWVPFPALFAYFVGVILVATGIGLLIRPMIRIAAATAGVMLVLLTLFFYVPILVLEFNTDLAIEGLNYVFDTLLFAGTVLLAGFGADARIFGESKNLPPSRREAKFGAWSRS
jgi:uncharacterized membrane protein